ncbi:uncharacterized protein LOC130671015 [Microplitis mediator]|uniref:uncharacterized protein LOC130671015 n=1 Tax=Microplitis mediator TaxID=375433 RepID=UPI0025552199|nr:uncharacterized protein LOC130671015 [Microplitis mediator]
MKKNSSDGKISMKLLVVFLVVAFFDTTYASKCIGKCDDYFDHLLEHEDCDKYCECTIWGEPIEYSCEDGKYFSYFWEKCVDPSLVDCTNVHLDTTLAPTSPSSTLPSTIPSTSSPTIEPSTTLPPTTVPPTSSPTTSSPTTSPPTTSPPTTEPSTTLPSTSSPTTEPATTSPPTTEPSTTLPPTTEPSTTSPPTTEPSTTSPPTTEPSTTSPPTTEPSTTSPPTTEPSTTSPPTTEPSTTSPPTTEPSTTSPPTTEPSTTVTSTSSPTTEPATTSPPTTEPSTTSPPTTEPSTTSPPTTEPSTTSPPTTEPSTTVTSTSSPTTEPSITTPPINKNGCIGTCPSLNLLDHADLLPNKNCSKFCMCNWGEAVPTNCPAGLFFNNKIKTCDWPFNVDCPNSPNRIENKLKYFASQRTLSKTVNHDNEITEQVDEQEDQEVAGCLGNCPITNSLDHTDHIAHKNCKKFCKCNWGKKIVFHCPLYLHFNNASKVCDFVFNANCTDVVLMVKIKRQYVTYCAPIVIVIKINQKMFKSLVIITLMTFAIAIEFSEPEEKNLNVNEVDGAEKNFQLKKSGSDCARQCKLFEFNKLAHEDCQKYCECTLGFLAEKKCKGNKYFSAKQKKCIDTYDQCSVSKNNKGCTKKCPAENSLDHTVHIAHRNCTLFCVCDFGHAEIINCPDDLFFNQKTQTCDYKSNVNCTEFIWSIAILGATAEQTREYEATNDMFPKTRSFLNRIKTTGTCIGKCPSFNDKLYFSHNLPHDDCDKYCMCMMGGYKLTRKCNGNNHYSELLNMCVSPKKANCLNKFDGCLGNCSMDRDGNFETALIAHQDCNKFCRCKENGRLELLTCADNLHFSVEHNCCVDPEEAKCRVEVPKSNTAAEDDKVGADAANQLNTNRNNQLDTEKFIKFEQAGANQLNTDGNNQLDTKKSHKFDQAGANQLNTDGNHQLDTEKSNKFDQTGANQLNTNGNNQLGTENYNKLDHAGANQLNTDGNNQLDNNEDNKLKFLDENDNEDADKNPIEGNSLNSEDDKEKIEVPAAEEDSADENHGECIGNCSSCGSRKPCLLPHKDCSRFCVCVDGFPFAKNCSAGLYFDTITRECVLSKYARCESGGDETEAGLKPSVEEGSDESGGNEIETTADEHGNDLAIVGPGPDPNNLNEDSTGARGNESAAVSSGDVRHDDHYDEDNDDHVDNGHDDKSNQSHADEIPKEINYVDNHHDDGTNYN